MLCLFCSERKFAVKIGYGSICSPFLNHVSPDNWFSVRIGDYATYRECLLSDRHSSSNVWQILRRCRPLIGCKYATPSKRAGIAIVK